MGVPVLASGEAGSASVARAGVQCTVCMGIMVNNLRFRDITTKASLKQAIKDEWSKITPQMCQNIITHYWKAGGWIRLEYP